MINSLFIFIMIIFALASIFSTQAFFSHKIDGESKLTINNDSSIFSNTIRGTSAVKLEEAINFLNASDETHFSIYHAEVGMESNNVSEAFEDSLIFETTFIANQYNMEVCFWDKQNQRMYFCINEGAPSRATTVRRSFQVVGNLTVKENDENFTLCENTNYIDCNTDATGADVFVQDDIEALGNIYAGGTVLANDFNVTNLVVGEQNCSKESHTFVTDAFANGQQNSIDITKQNFTLLVCDKSAAWNETVEIDT